MNEQTLHDELCEIVREHAPGALQTGVITPTTRFAEDLGLDSFSLVCVAFAVRDRYAIGSDPDLATIADMNDLARFVINKTGGDRSAA